MEWDKIIKKININKITNPITLLAFGFFLLTILGTILTKSLSNENHKFVICILIIVGFIIIILYSIHMAKSFINTQARQSLHDKPKHIEKRVQQMEDEL